MSNQLHLGFQLELFDQADYSQIFFALEFIYNILENNCQLFMLKVDKPMMHGMLFVFIFFFLTLPAFY